MAKDEAKKIIIDKDLCIGCGTCVGITPEHFKLGSDGKSEVIKQYTKEDDKVITEAKNSCPVSAISIR